MKTIYNFGLALSTFGFFLLLAVYGEDIFNFVVNNKITIAWGCFNIGISLMLFVFFYKELDKIK